MRILLAIGSSEIGGGQVVFLNCLRKFVQQGCTVEVLLPKGPLVKSVNIYGVQVHIVDSSSLLSLFVIARLLWRGRFEIVNTHLTRCSLMFALVNISLRVPLCCTLHNAIVHEGLNVTQKYVYPVFYRLIQMLSDGIIATSEQNRRHFISAAGMNSRLVKVIYPGIDVTGFTPHQRPRPNHGSFVIGTVGRLSVEKGTIFLLDALRKISDVPYECLIVGDGPCRGMLEQYVQDHRLSERVRFLGFREDVTAVMTSMDVVVVPSLNEAFGLTIVEAFVLGKPVIASAVGGIPELIKDNITGLLFPPRNSDALAEKLIFAYRNPDEICRTAQNALCTVQKRFSSAIMAEETLRYYAEILSRRNWAAN